MVICLICGFRSDMDEKNFFSVPGVRKGPGTEKELSERRRLLWLNRMNVQETDVTRFSCVCSNHFISGSPSRLFDCGSLDWAPCINLAFNESQHAVELEQDMESNISIISLNDNVEQELESTSMSTSKISMECMTDVSGIDINESISINTSKMDVECMTDVSGIDMDKSISINTSKMDVECMTDISFTDLKKINQELKMLRESYEVLHNKLDGIQKNFILDEHSLEGNDVKVKFYTGIPTFNLLKLIFNLVSVNIEPSLRCSLTLFQEFILVLMRLRLNLLQKDLGYRFQISQSSVSQIISKWLPVMAARLQCFVVWPDRKDLQKTMPEAFHDSFGDNVCVIIDCFEVFIDRSSSLLPRTATYSQYKHHNTVKFLIGITPQGSISFISKGWAGRASDKEITENCGILNNLRKGDKVLADRGFNCADSVAFYCATICIPAFTKGKPQLSEEDVETTRKIANLRIHVERVIGLVRKKYRILKGILPVQTLTVREGKSNAPIDEIVLICCALTNLCPGIVITGINDSEDEDEDENDYATEPSKKNNKHQEEGEEKKSLKRYDHETNKQDKAKREGEKGIEEKAVTIGNNKNDQKFEQREAEDKKTGEKRPKQWETFENAISKKLKEKIEINDTTDEFKKINNDQKFEQREAEDKKTGEKRPKQWETFENAISKKLKEKLEINDTTDEFKKINNELERVRKNFQFLIPEIRDPVFRRKFTQNEPFTICGRIIYASDLQSLIPLGNVEETARLYLNDSIMDCYLAMIINEEKNFFKNINLSVFAVECAVMNSAYQTSSYQTESRQNPFHHGIRHFLRFDVPVNDIILYPLIIGSHIRMCLILTKMKILIYLNTYWEVYPQIPEREISFFMKCFKCFCLFRNIPFDLKEWSFYSPRDVPQQSNGFDCGPLQLLLAEICIKRTENVALPNIFTYRGEIRRKIFIEMQKYSLPFAETEWDEEKLKKYPEPNMGNIIFSDEIPNYHGRTVEFLSEVVENYLGQIDIICAGCCNEYLDREPMESCVSCKNLYHKECRAIGKNETKYFVCARCTEKLHSIGTRFEVDSMVGLTGEKCENCCRGDRNYDLVKCHRCQGLYHAHCGDFKNYLCFLCQLDDFDELF